MRKVFVIAWNSLLQAARDPKSLVFALVLPVLATWIMGNMLKGMLGETTVTPASVLVINADPSTGTLLVQALTENPDLRRVAAFRPAPELDGAREQVTAGKATAALYIPPTFTADALAGRESRLDVYTDPADATRASIVMEVVRSIAGGLATRLQNGGLAPSTAITEVPAGTRAVSAMQYYAVACSLLFMVVTALMRGGQVLRERSAGTLQRMLATPTRRGEVVAGLTLGSALLNVGQWLLLLPVTHFALGVAWGPWLPAIALGCAFALASAGIGTAATAVLRDQKAADMASGTLGNLLGVLSGALVPLYAFPDALKLVARFTPNYWAMQGFLDQMSGTGQGRLALPIAVLTLTALATGAFGTWRLAAD